MKITVWLDFRNFWPRVSGKFVKRDLADEAWGKLYAGSSGDGIKFNFDRGIIFDPQ